MCLFFLDLRVPVRSLKGEKVRSMVESKFAKIRISVTTVEKEARTPPHESTFPTYLCSFFSMSLKLLYPFNHTTNDGGQQMYGTCVDESTRPATY